MNSEFNRPKTGAHEAISKKRPESANGAVRLGSDQFANSQPELSQPKTNQPKTNQPKTNQPKTSQPGIKKLSEKQLERFDKEFVAREKWDCFQKLVEEKYPDGRFSLLDVGGGNGKFADRILATFPNAQVTLFDNADNLLKKNVPHLGKTMIHASVEDIETALGDKTFDIISINWVLHHLVGDTYGRSRHFVHETLVKMKQRLKPGGHLSVFENMYNGIVFSGLPSHLIFFLTTRKNKRLNKILNRMGANTVGIGVCFQSHKQWNKTFQKAGLKSIQFTRFNKWNMTWMKRIFLHLGPVRIGHYWLENDD